MKYLRLTPRQNVVESFDSLFQPFFDNFQTRTMRTDVTERENDYLFEIEMAGVDKEHIEITLNDGYMTVSANTENQTETKENGYLCRERSSGNYSRSYYVGDVEEKDISAKYDKGILEVTVAKQQKKIPARISIN